MSDNQSNKAPIPPSIAEDLKSIRVFHRQIVENETLETMQENVFVENFLPFFLGEIEDNDQTNFGLTWSALSGRGTSEVQIVDGFNQPLYKVPAFFDTEVLDVTRSDIFNVMKDYAIDKDIHPVMATNKAMNSLREEFKKIQRSSPISESNKKRWIEIFKRYRSAEELKHLFARHNGKTDVKATEPERPKSLTDMGPNYDD